MPACSTTRLRKREQKPEGRVLQIGVPEDIPVLVQVRLEKMHHMTKANHAESVSWSV